MTDSDYIQMTPEWKHSELALLGSLNDRLPYRGLPCHSIAFMEWLQFI